MKGSPRTAMTIVAAAIALMLAAGTGATASLLITGKQIKDGSVTSADIKNKSLKVKDLSTKAKTKLKGATGPAGARGATGPAGPQGPAGTSGLPGLPGLSGFEVITKSVPIPALSGLLGGTASTSRRVSGGQEGAVGDELGDRATGQPHERRQPGDADGGGHLQRQRAEPARSSRRP